MAHSNAVSQSHGYTTTFKLCTQTMLMMLAMAAAGSVVEAATKRAPVPELELLAPAPAPAPLPKFKNVTEALVYGGNYDTFIDLLVETKQDVAFQAMANNSEGPGVTIFAPTDAAFSSKLVKTLLANLTGAQKVALVQYQALGVYQAFKNLQNSDNNQTSTLASKGPGSYQVNITFTGGGRLQISSGWTKALLSTTVYSKRPVSIFAIDHVLLPDEIFGLPPSPPPPSPPPPVVRSPPPPAPSPSSPLKSTPSNNASFSSCFLASPISYVFISLLLSKFLDLIFL